LYARLRALSNDFKHTPVERSRIFGKIRSGGNRSTECRLRAGLIRAGIRGWRVRPKEVLGQPDFFFDRQKVAVFVDGCYWHGCTTCGHVPKNNSSFWRLKFALTKKRDRKVVRELRLLGFKTLRIWEHQLADELQSCLRKIRICVQKGAR